MIETIDIEPMNYDKANQVLTYNGKRYPCPIVIWELIQQECETLDARVKGYINLLIIKSNK